MSLAAFAAPNVQAGQTGLFYASLRNAPSGSQVSAKVPAFPRRLDWLDIRWTESILVLVVLVEHCCVHQLCLLFW